MNTEPVAEVVDGWVQRGGAADATWAEVPLVFPTVPEPSQAQRAAA
jgi:hypothetical protein